MQACPATQAGLSRRGFLLAAGLAATAPAWLSLTDAARAASLASGLPAQANYFERAFGITPADGQRYGFAVSVSDNDRESENIQQSMVSMAPARRLADPTTWAVLLLRK